MRVARVYLRRKLVYEQLHVFQNSGGIRIAFLCTRKCPSWRVWGRWQQWLRTASCDERLVSSALWLWDSLYLIHISCSREIAEVGFRQQC